MARPTRFRDKWRIRWMDEDGRRQSAVFETHVEAIYQLQRRQARVEEIKRGLRSRTPKSRAFGELCDYWLRVRTARKRSPKDDYSIIRCHLRPAFGGLSLAEINVEAVDRYQAERRHLANKTVANHLTLLISMLNAAVDLGWLTKKPRIRKPQTRMFARDYRYLRTDEEVQILLRVAKAKGHDLLALYATAIFTGMRQGELAALRWDDVDFEQRLIVVQRSFDGPTKADDVRYVPILDVLLPILRDWRLLCPGTLVFPNQAGHMHQPGARIFRQRFHRLLDAAGFTRPPETARETHYINFHSLRHTFASHWVMKGGDLFKLQKILGHKTMDMTMRYAHLAPGAFAADHSRFGALNVYGKSKVLPLKRGEKW